MVGMQIKNTHLDGNSTNFQNYPGRALFGIPKVPGAFWTLRVCPGTRRPPDLARNLLKWAQVVLGPTGSTWGGLRSTGWGAQNAKVDVK